MPVILVQRIINQSLILQKHAHPQQEEARHKERIRPRLLGKVVVDRDGVLQNMIPEAQRFFFQILDLAFGDVQTLSVLSIVKSNLLYSIESRS